MAAARHDPADTSDRSDAEDSVFDLSPLSSDQEEGDDTATATTSDELPRSWPRQPGGDGPLPVPPPRHGNLPQAGAHGVERRYASASSIPIARAESRGAAAALPATTGAGPTLVSVPITTPTKTPTAGGIPRRRAAPGGSTLGKYIQRFRHAPPLSRESRDRLRASRMGNSAEFWWLGSGNGSGAADHPNVRDGGGGGVRVAGALDGRHGVALSPAPRTAEPAPPPNPVDMGSFFAVSDESFSSPSTVSNSGLACTPPAQSHPARPYRHRPSGNDDAGGLKVETLAKMQRRVEALVAQSEHAMEGRVPGGGGRVASASGGAAAASGLAPVPHPDWSPVSDSDTNLEHQGNPWELSPYSSKPPVFPGPGPAAAAATGTGGRDLPPPSTADLRQQNHHCQAHLQQQPQPPVPTPHAFVVDLAGEDGEDGDILAQWRRRRALGDSDRPNRSSAVTGTAITHPYGTAVVPTPPPQMAEQEMYLPAFISAPGALPASPSSAGGHSVPTSETEPPASETDSETRWGDRLNMWARQPGRPASDIRSIATQTTQSTQATQTDQDLGDHSEIVPKAHPDPPSPPSPPMRPDPGDASSQAGVESKPEPTSGTRCSNPDGDASSSRRRRHTMSATASSVLPRRSMALPRGPDNDVGTEAASVATATATATAIATATTTAAQTTQNGSPASTLSVSASASACPAWIHAGHGVLDTPPHILERRVLEALDKAVTDDSISSPASASESTGSQPHEATAAASSAVRTELATAEVADTGRTGAGTLQPLHGTRSAEYVMSPLRNTTFTPAPPAEPEPESEPAPAYVARITSSLNAAAVEESGFDVFATDGMLLALKSRAHALRLELTRTDAALLKLR